MKLLVLAEGYPYGNSLAGVFHVNQLRLITHAGVDVTVVAPTPWVPPGLAGLKDRWRQYDQAPRIQEVDGFKVLRPRYPAFPGEHKFPLQHLFQYMAVRTLNLPQPDIIQSFFALPLGAVGNLLAEKWNVPHVVNMLGDDVTVMPYLSEGHRRLFTRVLEQADGVLATGPSLAAEAENISGCPVGSLALGVNKERFINLPSKEEARRQLDLPEDAFLALYVGGLLEPKGVLEFLEALPMVRSKKVIGLFVGDGPERQQVKQTPRALSVGFQPPEKVPAYMAAADVLLLPSHHEGLPNVVIEAGFAGLPVIGTDIGGIVDLIGDNRGYIVPVKSPENIASTIDYVAANPEEAARTAKCLGEHAMAHYEVHSTTKRLVELYRSLVKEPS